MPLLPQPGRILADVTDKGPVVDLNAGEDSTPEVWNGEDWQLDFALGFKQLIATDLSNVASVMAEVFSAQSSVVAPLLSKTLAIGAMNPALTQGQWDAGTGVHGSFKFTNEETDLVLTTVKQTLWLKITVTTTDVPVKIFPVCEGPIIWLESPSSGGVAQGGNIVAAGAVYDGAGHLVVNVTAGRSYQWTKGANDTSLTNGTQTVNATGGIFIAQGTTVTLNGTATAAVTAIVWNVGSLTADQGDARWAQVSPNPGNYRVTSDGNFQLWDAGYAATDITKPWCQLILDANGISKSGPIAN